MARFARLDGAHGFLIETGVTYFLAGSEDVLDPVHRWVVAVGEFSAQLLTMLGSSACSAIGWD
ncbi:MAG: hypothetical protein R5N65_00140 [Cutibacterium granulosum]|uniref:hypothetical protein n=1 Tax=Cutibacterium granulosum TaxID=33011 RepID=UPI002B228BC4|nr:hypothetical protein [Cutibacterium granulosum]MEA5644010.1 hypothetical protein [Cutibacterium granulosum]